MQKYETYFFYLSIYYNIPLLYFLFQQCTLENVVEHVFQNQKNNTLLVFK